MVGIMLGLITVFKYIDGIIPKTPLGYAWLELYMVFGVIMLLVLPFMTSLLVLITAPFLRFALGQTFQASLASFILDYTSLVLGLLIVYPMKFIKNKWIFIPCLILLIIVIFSIKEFWHTTSGVVAYKVSWGLSSSLNALIVFITMAAMVFALIMIPKLKMLQKLATKKEFKWS
ncbi:hypothetical protein [Candidatus Mycoplasma mahonii]|uniref:hypothetical protein n=1 Tax=Candidatus Mycoplasma mahonii TaxID=3004105 RepID=UPI0026EF4D4E|nr:hypothetical protein [Candidatus Mycoplasma mahonii]WKX02754.1 hypothetical protein O3I44_01630 [Candidatus Mycoplasma mahonii]